MKVLFISVLCCLCLTGCSNVSKGAATTPISSEAICNIKAIDTVSVVEEIEEVVLITNSPCDIVFDNVEYDLPISLFELLSEEWILAPGQPNEFLESGETLEDVKLLNKHYPESIVIVDITNTSATTKLYSKCDVTCLVVSVLDNTAPHVCVDNVVLGNQLPEEAFNSVDNDLAIHCKVNSEGTVTTLGVSCLDRDTKSAAYKWSSVPKLTISGIEVKLPTDAVRLQEHGWNLEPVDGVFSGTRDDTDAVLTLYGNTGEFNGIVIREREVCIDVYCYGLSFDSDIDDVIETLGNSYYSYYIIGNKSYLTYQSDTCYLTVVLTGDMINEFRLSNCQPLFNFY